MVQRSLSVLVPSRSLLVVVSALLLAGSISAQSAQSGATPAGKTYYVSSSGNDASSGLAPFHAWSSVARVNRQVLEPGDRVLFAAGEVFPGTIVLGKDESGTPEEMITFASFGDGRAEIRAGNGTGFDLVDVAGIRISNLFVSGSGFETNEGIGISFFTALPGDVKLSSIRVDGCRVSGFRSGGISIGSRKGRSGFQDVRVDHCRLDHDGDDGMKVWGSYDPTWGQAIEDYAHRSIYIAHNVFESNWGDPRRTTTHTGSGCVVAQAAGVLIEHNEALDNGGLNSFKGGGPVGLWLWDVLYGVMQYNESHHNKSATIDGGGFDLDGGTRSCLMQYNYSHDNDGAGFMMYQFAKGARPMVDVTARYNVSRRDGGRGGSGALQLWNDDRVGPPITGARFHDNHVTVEAKSAGVPRAFRVTGSGGVTRSNFSDNVFVARGASVWLGEVTLSPAPEWKGNYFLADAGAFVLHDGGVTYSSLDAWIKATGHERYQGVLRRGCRTIRC